jgi:protein O-mannosyl-transferase
LNATIYPLGILIAVPKRNPTTRPRETPPRIAHAHGTLATWWPIVFLALAGVLAYANAFPAVFLFDGKKYILEDNRVHQLWPPAYALDNTRPLVYVTFALNYASGGVNPAGYVAVNLVIHVLCGALLFGFIRRTLRLPTFQDRFDESADRLALLAALLWLVHPLQTQAVTYIYQRLESLPSLLIVLTCYCFVRGIEGKAIWWHAASVAACAAGMACKELMVVAPVLVLWYDRALVAESWRTLVARRWGYYLALFSTLSILFSLIGAHQGKYADAGIGFESELSSWRYAITQSEVILHYIRLWYLPIGQCLDYYWPMANSVWDVWPSLVLLLALLSGFLWSVWKHPAIGFLGCWFFVLLAPTSSVVPIADAIFEHRAYLASAALAVVTALALDTLASRLARALANDVKGPTVYWTAAFAAVVMLGLLTHLRNRVYYSELAMWTDVTGKVPTNPRAWVSLGDVWTAAEEYELAEQCYQRSLRLYPNFTYAHSEYGRLLTKLHRFDEAREHFTAALECTPGDDHTLAELGLMYLEQGRADEAIDCNLRSLEKNPTNCALRVNLAAALILAGRPNEAIEQCRLALTQDPEFVDAHVNLATAFGALGMEEQALEHCRLAIRIDPEHAGANATTAKLLAAADPTTAKRHMTKAFALNPRSPEIQLGMGNLVAPEQPDQAIPYFREALRLKPDYPEAHFNLANALVAIGDPGSAVEHLQAAARLRPEWEEPRKNLEILTAALARMQRGSDLNPQQNPLPIKPPQE